MKQDRNALQDLLDILQSVDGFDDLRDYWSSKWASEAAWGACVVAKSPLGMLAIAGPKGLSFPGGKPEPDETPFECAARELYEETGYILPPTGTVVGSPFPTENHVPVFPVYVSFQNLSGTPWGSAEGFPCIVAESFLIGGSARLPKWNFEAMARGNWR